MSKYHWLQTILHFFRSNYRSYKTWLHVAVPVSKLSVGYGGTGSDGVGDGEGSGSCDTMSMPVTDKSASRSSWGMTGCRPTSAPSRPSHWITGGSSGFWQLRFLLAGGSSRDRLVTALAPPPVAPAVSILTAVRLRCAETAAVATAAFAAATAGLAAVVAVAGLEAASSE